MKERLQNVRDFVEEIVEGHMPPLTMNMPMTRMMKTSMLRNSRRSYDYL